MAKRNSSGDEDQLSLQSLSPLMHSNSSVKVDDKLVEQLMGTEQLCNKLRYDIFMFSFFDCSNFVFLEIAFWTSAET